MQHIEAFIKYSCINVGVLYTSYCETYKTVNTGNIHGMLLCCEEKANKV